MTTKTPLRPLSTSPHTKPAPPPVRTFTIPGHAQAKQRARTTFRGGVARTYTPDKTRNFEAWVKKCAIDAGIPLYAGPVRLEVVIVRVWPQSLSKRARERGALPITRPDGKNTYSAIEDALNGIAYFDDAQIVVGVFRKVYGAIPQTVVTVEPYRAKEVA